MEEIILCRSCMQEFVKNEVYDSKLVAKFYFCTNIVISENDELTQQFCCECAHKIEFTYNFIKEAQRVNHILSNGRLNSKIRFSNDNDKNVPFKQDPHSGLNIISDLPKTNVSNINIHFPCEEYDLNDLDNYKEIDDIQETLDNHNFIPDSNLIKKQYLTEKSPRLSNLTYPLSYNDEYDNSDHFKETVDDNADTNEAIIHHTRKKVCIACKACKKVFKIKKAYYDHKKKHALRQTVCDRCNKDFQSLYKLQAHRYMCVKENFTVACEQCGLKLRNQTKLKLHVTSKHSQERPYSCDVCCKRFKFKRILEQHKGIHSNIKPFLCEVCGLSLTQANTLKEHIKTHTEEKPYKCDLCDFQAKRMFSLNRHKRLHTGERLHQCSCCGKKFYEPFELKQHIRKHTGELPYNCPLCTRKFINSTKRKEHMVRSHKIALCDIPRMNKNGETLIGEE